MTKIETQAAKLAESLIAGDGYADAFKWGGTVGTMNYRTAKNLVKTAKNVYGYVRMAGDGQYVKMVKAEALSIISMINEENPEMDYSDFMGSTDGSVYFD